MKAKEFSGMSFQQVQDSANEKFTKYWEEKDIIRTILLLVANLAARCKEEFEALVALDESLSLDKAKELLEEMAEYFYQRSDGFCVVCGAKDYPVCGDKQGYAEVSPEEAEEWNIDHAEGCVVAKIDQALAALECQTCRGSEEIEISKPFDAGYRKIPCPKGCQPKPELSETPVIGGEQANAPVPEPSEFVKELREKVLQLQLYDSAGSRSPDITYTEVFKLCDRIAQLEAEEKAIIKKYHDTLTTANREYTVLFKKNEQLEAELVEAKCKKPKKTNCPNTKCWVQDVRDELIDENDALRGTICLQKQRIKELEKGE